jgi:very-short-patch-repair endonuclease
VTPSELLGGPFTLAEARRAGLTRSALRGKHWQRLSKGLDSARRPADTPLQVLQGWLRVLPQGATFAGGTAAWLHGLEVDPRSPIEVIVGPDKGVRSRPGLTSRRCVLDIEDVEIVRGLPATTVHRTLIDLCCWRTPVEALVVIDMSIAASLSDPVEMVRYANSTQGKAGSARLRELARIAEPAESPMETRLRWLLLTAGLPRPQVQVDLRGDHGTFLARADLFYPTAHHVIEFDGANHKERVVSDHRRQNALLNAGYRLLRYTTAELKGRPEVIVAQVQAALGLTAIRAHGSIRV